MHDLDDFFAVAWPPDREHLHELLEEMCVDAHGPEEQIMGILTTFEEYAALPKPATLAGREIRFVDVEDRGDVLGATVVRASEGFSVFLEDVRPEDGTPAAFLIAAYRLWRCLEPIVPEPHHLGDPGTSSRRSDDG